MVRASGVTALSQRPVFVGRRTGSGLVRTTREQIVFAVVGAAGYFTLLAPDQSSNCGC
jgi:hypothetical protein